MRTKRWRRMAGAALLLLTVAGAYKAAAVPLRGGAPCPATVPDTVVHGRRLVTFGGYELNISFTPAGRLVGLDIAKH